MQLFYYSETLRISAHWTHGDLNAAVHVWFSSPPSSHIYNTTCLFASVTPSVLPLGVISSRVRMSDLLLLKHKAASEREAAKCGRAVWDPDRNCRHASGISCADALWKDEFKFGAVVPSCVQIRLTPLRLEQINTLRPEIALEANWRLRNRPKRCPAC